MNDAVDILQKVRETAKLRILFLPHALQQMTRPDRMIRAKEVRLAVEQGRVIEDYPEDARGHSCLILHYAERALHVVCAPKEEYLAIITAYLPHPNEWTDNFSKRKKS